MSEILTNILNFLFMYTKDWGIAIVGLTLAVKVLLIPMSIKQKKSMIKQQKISEHVNEIKLKYKNNEDKMNEEINNYYKENSSTIMGGLIILIQIPIVLILFKVIRSIDINTGSIIVPWVKNLKSYDTSYIVPIIYTVMSLSPSFIDYIQNIKASRIIKQNIISTIIMSLMITLKSPVAIGIYFITSSFVSIIEDLIFRKIKKIELMSQE